MKNITLSLCWRPLVAAVVVLELAACSTLRAGAPSPPTIYALEAPRGVAAPAAVPAATAPTLVVSRPHASAGFDSPRIMYVRENHKLEYFAHNEWVDPPARMLAPLLVSALQNTGAFRAVLLAPSSADADLRLDTELIRLQQEFLVHPSQARFTLRAYLVEDKTRRVLAWREFDLSVPAASEDPYGGVVAANQAVQSALQSLAAFCVEGAARRAPMKE